MDRQDKKAQFEQGKKRNLLPLILIALIVTAAAGFAGWTAFGGQKGGFQSVTGTQGTIAIPLAKISDGNAHFFSFRSNDATVNFFVLKSHDGVLRAAFDTCDVCYRAKKGYRQDGDSMVCNNCDQRFRADMINEVKGGCNPAPLERTIADGNLLIAEADLLKGAWYFKSE
jgi:uncharacterized membrane protein